MYVIVLKILYLFVLYASQLAASPSYCWPWFKTVTSQVILVGQSLKKLQSFDFLHFQTSVSIYISLMKKLMCSSEVTLV